MIIDVVTAFPAIVKPALNESIIGRALQQQIVTVRIHDLRQWTSDKHKTIDDTPYGGGAGMILKVEPLYRCLMDLTDNGTSKTRIILTSPRGQLLNQSSVTRLSLVDHLILVCGRYKGVDQRITKLFDIHEVSIGDYILSGGELAALVIIDAVVRLLPGAIGDINSAWSDSFNDYLLDCDYYTRPEIFRDHCVPKILLSGNHEKISQWRQKEREKITKENRPDLYKKYLQKINQK